MFKNPDIQRAASQDGLAVIDANLHKEVEQLYAYISNHFKFTATDFYYSLMANTYETNKVIQKALLEILHNFFETVKGDKILIIGDMMELGVHADEEHKKLLLNLKNFPLKQVILVGENFRRHAELIDAVSFLNTAEALDWLKKQHYENTTFLIKGSRKMQLEKAIDCL